MDIYEKKTLLLFLDEELLLGAFNFIDPLGFVIIVEGAEA